MKAVFTPEYGSPDVLVVREVSLPDVGPEQVRVDLDALAVTAGDRRLRSADFPGVSWLPGLLFAGISRPRNAIQGTVFAGRVGAVGAQVSRWKVGDEVFGLAMHGANAESIVVDAASAMGRRPDGLSALDAVTLPYGAGTALHFLRELAAVQPGERVLILGASGGVGPYAVQIARHLGAHVTATCSAEKVARVQELGADQVLDYRRSDVATLGETFDVVFDIADSTDFWRSRPLLTPTGRYLTLTASLGVLGAMAATYWSSQRALTGVAMDTPGGMDTLATLWWEGAIRPVVANEFQFPAVADAHRAVEAGAGTGTVVVAVN